MRIRINRQIVLKFAHYPVLFIIGQKDRILPYTKLIEESKLSEYADYLLLEDTGHMGFIEDKQSCLQAINVFLKRPKV